MSDDHRLFIRLYLATLKRTNSYAIAWPKPCDAPVITIVFVSLQIRSSLLLLDVVDSFVSSLDTICNCCDCIKDNLALLGWIGDRNPTWARNVLAP